MCGMRPCSRVYEILMWKLLRCAVRRVRKIIVCGFCIFTWTSERRATMLWCSQCIQFDGCRHNRIIASSRGWHTKAYTLYAYSRQPVFLIFIVVFWLCAWHCESGGGSAEQTQVHNTLVCLHTCIEYGTFASKYICLNISRDENYAWLRK